MENCGFSKVPGTAGRAACKAIFDPDLEQGGAAPDDADRGTLVAQPKLRHPGPDWRLEVGAVVSLAGICAGGGQATAVPTEPPRFQWLTKYTD
jgi:hypothetical protein